MKSCDAIIHSMYSSSKAIEVEDKLKPRLAMTTQVCIEDKAHAQLGRISALIPCFEVFSYRAHLVFSYGLKIDAVDACDIHRLESRGAALGDVGQCYSENSVDVSHPPTPSNINSTISEVESLASSTIDLDSHIQDCRLLW